MTNATSYGPLSKNFRSNDDLDFLFLREKGISYIQELSRTIWTDFNTHDPGVTLLEILCYGITDLGYRLSLPVQDLLFDGEKRNYLKDHFHLGPEVLPCKALTTLDYRMLFIDLEGVKNCWLEPYTKKVYADCKHFKLSYDPGIWEGLPQKYHRSFDLRGLHRIIVDTEPGASIASIKKQIFRLYHANRNLCEDLVEVVEVVTQPIQVCAIIDIAPEADEESVSATIQWKIDQYFSPDLPFYSFREMSAKGYSMDQMFEGPSLTHGFLDPEEVKNASLRTEVRQSDIIQLIMEVEGVNSIRDIRINNCEEGSVQGSWVLQIDPGKKPGLCDKSKFNFYKGLLPVNVNETEVKAQKDRLQRQQFEERYQGNAKVPSMPEPDNYPLGEYISIRNDFPEVYGVGPVGLPDSVDAVRKVQTRQFKSYLTFFDQILGSYFQHLSQVKSLLSVFTTSERTYFSQAITDIGDEADFLNAEYAEDAFQNALFSDFDESNARNQRIKDHLLARFAEKFSEYAFIMKKIYGEGVDQQVLDTKSRFLKEYGGFSLERATAMNYYRQPLTNLWDSKNTSGVEKEWLYWQEFGISCEKIWPDHLWRSIRLLMQVVTLFTVGGFMINTGAYY